MESVHSQRILVVDDEEMMCLTLLEFLRQEGYHCQSATDPVEALAMLDQDNFEMVISDIRMPGMSGLDLLHEIRLKRPDIATIIMTAFTSEHSYSDIIDAGASDFIGKPFQLSELKAKIERVNRERKTLRDLQEMNAALLHRERELEKRTKELEAVNVALGVLLKRRDRDNAEFADKITINMRELVIPYIEKLKAGRLEDMQRIHLDILETNITEICSPFLKGLKGKFLHLSPMEIQVANLIKTGQGNKKMSEALGVSLNTIMAHRYHLRTKLGVKGKKVNLQNYLNSIEF